MMTAPVEIAFAQGRLLMNARWSPDRVWTDTPACQPSRVACDRAAADIAGWPGYVPTPIVSLPGLAGRLGLGRIDAKDEGSRFGIGSFKALGAAYALAVRLSYRLSRRLGRRAAPVEFLEGRHRAACAGLTVAAATDGNHGRALAWAAARAGCRAVIYVPIAVSPGRVAALRGYGAEVVGGYPTYDDAVADCAAQSRRHRWIEVTDTVVALRRDAAATATARLIMAGYAVMIDESLAACAEPPTHVFAQAGVGGFAAAAALRLWQRRGRTVTRLIVVEPEQAACAYASAVAGAPKPAEGDLATVMAGLACGEVSVPSWTILSESASAFMRVGDEWAIAAMRQLALPVAGDSRIVGGETGSAGLAGLLAVAADPQARRAVDLGMDSRVLVVVTEGATDPDLYTKLTGLVGTA